MRFAVDSLHFLYHIWGVKVTVFDEGKPLFTDVEITERGVSKEDNFYLTRVIDAVWEAAGDYPHTCLESVGIFKL